IEDVHEGLLGNLRHSLDATFTDGDVDKVGRGRRVVVPQSMPDELVVPYLLAGRRLEAHEAVAIKAVPWTMPAIVVVGGRADRQINVAELLIRAHWRPDVGVPGFLPGIVLPSLDSGLARLGNRVEGPKQAAGAHVEAAYVARRRRPLGPPVHDRRAHD